MTLAETATPTAGGPVSPSSGGFLSLKGPIYSCKSKEGFFQ